MSEKIAPVSKAGFTFCRYSVAIIIWIALIFQIKELILFSFIILLLSALFTVKYAPMIKLYDYTIGLFFKGEKEILNLNAMRFAHSLGTIFSLICLIFLYFVNEPTGWIIVFFFAIIKTISAFGFCPASKLYSCATNGSCCAFARKMNKAKDIKNKKKK